jgi:hypothetical protein
MDRTVSIVSQTACELDSTLDAIEGHSASLFSFILILTPVNVIKGRLWDNMLEFDRDTDCDRFRAFYKEQHGEYHSWVARVVADFVKHRKANFIIQYRSQS